MNTPLASARYGARLELVLDRPARRNALSSQLITDLTAALRAADEDEAVRVVLLTGAGTAFCAGLDLHELTARDGAMEPEAEARTHDLAPLLTLYDTLEGLTKPSVAAVNGLAVAGGATLASLCDVVLCGASGGFGFPGIRRGLVAPIFMPYLVRQVGLRRARYLLLTGTLLSPAEAVACGLADEVVGDTELLEAARARGDALAALAPTAVSRTKALLRRWRLTGGGPASEEMRQVSAALTLDEQARAGVRRFLGL